MEQTDDDRSRRSLGRSRRTAATRSRRPTVERGCASNWRPSHRGRNGWWPQGEEDDGPGCPATLRRKGGSREPTTDHARRLSGDVVEELAETGNFDVAKMMGMPALKRDGKMFGGYADGMSLVKLPDRLDPEGIPSPLDIAPGAPAPDRVELLRQMGG